MAIVMFGPLIIGARGTIAGTILSANKAGPYARGWARGANPRTSDQAVIRAYTGAHAAAWRGLTQGQRDTWDLWAALGAQDKTNSLGETYSASGFNWFVAINNRLLVAGRATRDNIPVIERPAAPTLTLFRLNTTAGAPLSRITYPWDEFVDWDVILFVALANSEGVIAKTFGWRNILACPTENENWSDFQPELEAAFGTIQLNQRGFCRLARQTTDGVRSSWTTRTADVE